MRLSSLSQDLLPATLVDALRALGIVSDADLFFSATTLEVWRKLPPDLISLSEFESRVKAVMLRCAVPGFVATGVGERSVSDQLKHDITTGVDSLDNLLGATLRESVVEISGRHGSGAAVWFLSLIYSIFQLKHYALGTGRIQRHLPCRPRAITWLLTRTRLRCGSIQQGTFLPRKRTSSSDRWSRARSVFRLWRQYDDSINDGYLQPGHANRTSAVRGRARI